MEVLSYDLELDVDFKHSTVKGSVSIALKGVRPRLRLDAVGLEVEDARVGGKQVRFTHDKAKGVLEVSGLPARSAVVDIEFTKHVRDDVIFGLYKSKYGDRHLLVTDLEPAEARTVFPCVDDPAYKAVFRLTVVADEGLSVIANMPESSRKSESGGRVRVGFAETPRMSTYLFFVGVGRFEEASVMSGRVKVIAASRPDQEGDSRFVLGVSAEVLQEYGRYFGIPYPLPKLHLVGLPEYHTGAMENWGAITSREHYVILRKDASDSERRNAARIMSHEIAHQWFGDLVTMDWWDDVWLNESFATFMEAMVLDRLHPEWDSWREFLRADTFRSLNADALSTTHPIQASVKRVEEVGSLFDAISYGKGASVLRMLETYIGAAAFRRGVSSYLKKFSYSNASGEDLWLALGTASGLPVSRVAKAWITKAGFPVVRTKCAKGKVLLRQEKFSLTGKESPELWPIPLTVAENGRAKTVLFSKQAGEIEAKRPEDVILNVRRTGFYSVLYDRSAYDRLAERFPSLHSHDRAGILNDLFLFLQAGVVEPREYFRFAALSGDIADPLLTLAVADHLVALRAIAGEAKSVVRAWDAFFGAQVKLLGLERRKGEDENIGIVREAVTSQSVKTDRRLAERLAGGFERFDLVDANLKTAVATAYARTRGVEGFDRLLSRAEKSQGEGERAKLYAALASYEEPELVRRVLDFTISGRVSRSDAGYTIIGAASNPFARSALWEWIKEHYDQVKVMYGSSQQFYLYLNSVVPRCGIGHEEDVRRFISGERYREGEMTFKRTFELLGVFSRLRERLLSA